MQSIHSFTGVGTYYYQQNDAALADLQPEASWFYSWSASKYNVAGSGQVIPMLGQDVPATAYCSAVLLSLAIVRVHPSYQSIAISFLQLHE